MPDVSSLVEEDERIVEENDIDHNLQPIKPTADDKSLLNLSSLSEETVKRISY